MAFGVLKQALTSPPLLALSDFHAPFVIECDASSTRIWAVLMQKNYPIAYIGQELKNPETYLYAYEREMLGIILATGK